MKKIVSVLALLALISMVLISGCNEPKQEPETFNPKFSFIEGSALFQKTALSLEIEDETVQSQEMKTLWLIGESDESSSEIQMIVLEAKQIMGEEELELCTTMPYYTKRSDIRFYSDGRVDYGAGAESVFKFPESEIQLGETWEFDGVDFELTGTEQYSNSAGDFNCLRIEFNGIVEETAGIATLEGFFLFDFSKGLMVLNHQEKTFTEGQKIIISNEIQGIEEKFTGEPDLSCVFASEGLSISEKLEFANNLFAENEFLGSVEIALAAKQELEAIQDLNELEKNQLLSAMALLADNYLYLQETEKEIVQRLQNAEFILPMLEENTIDVTKFAQAFLDLQKVSESELDIAEQATPKLEDLNNRIAGFIKGTAAFSDTGNRKGLKIKSIQGNLTLNFEVPEFAGGYSMPVLDLKEGNEFTLLYYGNGYIPQALPPIQVNNETFNGEYSVALKPMTDLNKGILTGLCYSTDETDSTEFLNSEITVFELGTENEPITTACENGFYSIELNPGQYALNEMSISQQIQAGKTTIANILGARQNN